MVKIIFYNLLRSKYNIKELMVAPGTIHQMIDAILLKVPAMRKSDFETCVVFYKGNPIHYRGFDQYIEKGEEIIITHFVGGG